MIRHMTYKRRMIFLKVSIHEHDYKNVANIIILLLLAHDLLSIITCCNIIGRVANGRAKLCHACNYVPLYNALLPECL